MESKQITINGKTYVVGVVKYKDVVAIGQVDNITAARKLLQLSTGMSDEEYEDLSMKDGIDIMKLVNDVNGLSDLSGNFQQK